MDNRVAADGALMVGGLIVMPRLAKAFILRRALEGLDGAIAAGAVDSSHQELAALAVLCQRHRVTVPPALAALMLRHGVDVPTGGTGGRDGDV